jgi:hypothetical protein
MLFNQFYNIILLYHVPWVSKGYNNLAVNMTIYNLVTHVWDNPAYVECVASKRLIYLISYSIVSGNHNQMESLVVSVGQSSSDESSYLAGFLSCPLARS